MVFDVAAASSQILPEILYTIWPIMASTLDSSDIAIALADEGVPLAAIARAIRVSSSDLREQLHEAQSDGRLLELPSDDWPVGCPRDQRALQISRMVRENREALHLVAVQLFGLTPSGARVLVKLLETERTSREALHIALSRTTYPVSDSKIVDVAICSVRKRLKKFGIEIVNVVGLWLPASRASTAAGPWTSFSGMPRHSRLVEHKNRLPLVFGGILEARAPAPSSPKQIGLSAPSRDPEGGSQLLIWAGTYSRFGGHRRAP